MTYQIPATYNDEPLLFWENEFEPFVVGSQVVAHSGRVAVVRTSVTDEGRPMRVKYRLARAADIAAWKAMVNSDPFPTTDLASYFDTGFNVIFSQNNPMPTPKNEILNDCGIGQTIFDSGEGDYKQGFDLWTGILNLIIVGAI